MQLARFYPYRLAVLSQEFSLAFTPIYEEQFGISRKEWRVLAALGENPQMSAREICQFSTLEKMQASRAIAQLGEKGLLKQIAEKQDRREKRVKLTPRGVEVYQQIVPLALLHEQQLLSALSEQELNALDAIVGKLQSHIRQSRDH